MTKIVNLENEIEIPEGVNIQLDGRNVTVEGPKGKLTKNFSQHTETDLILDGSILKFTSYFLNKRAKAKSLALVGLINNMIKGVTQGYTYKSKIVFSHFPITVEPDNKKRKIVIKNLYGGRKQLVVDIVGEDTQVKIEGDDVITEGINKEAVGQTAANMQEVCRLRGKRKKDPEVFMDGIWLFEK